jgi:hypothetical protein
VQAIPRLLAVPSLLVALAGPLASQAEAAEALARLLAGLVESGVIEPGDPGNVDGGGVVSLKAEPHPGPGHGRELLAPFGGPVFPTAPAPAPDVTRLALLTVHHGAAPDPSTACRRRARLQVLQL